MPKTKSEQTAKTVQFFPHKSKIPQNTAQEEVLDAAFKLTKALKEFNLAAHPMKDNKATTNALNELATIFLKRSQTDSPPRVVKTTNTPRTIASPRVSKVNPPSQRPSQHSLTV